MSDRRTRHGARVGYSKYEKLVLFLMLAAGARTAFSVIQGRGDK